MVRLYCGLPGSGKSTEIRHEIEHLLPDKDNTVILLTTDCEGLPQSDNLLAFPRFSIGSIEQCIKWQETAQAINPNKMGFLYIDVPSIWHRETAEALAEKILEADEKGMRVCIAMQSFERVSKYAPTLFKSPNCECYIVSKNRHPRLATPEDLQKYNAKSE